QFGAKLFDQRRHLSISGEKQDLAASPAAKASETCRFESTSFDDDPRAKPEAAASTRLLGERPANLELRGAYLDVIANLKLETIEQHRGNDRASAGDFRIIELASVGKLELAEQGKTCFDSLELDHHRAFMLQVRRAEHR